MIVSIQVSVLVDVRTWPSEWQSQMLWRASFSLLVINLDWMAFDSICCWFIFFRLHLCINCLVMVQCIQKVFTLHLFHILSFYNPVSKWIWFNFSSKFYTQEWQNEKVLLTFFQIKKTKKTNNNNNNIMCINIQQYFSQYSVCWSTRHPLVFLIMLQPWHTYFSGGVFHSSSQNL